jgi:hypothetical protein
VQDWGVHPVFAITALFPLFVSFSALLIDEQRVTQSGRQSGPLRQASSGGGASGSGSFSGSFSGASAGSGGGRAHAHAHASGGPAHAAPPVLGALAARVRTQGLALWGAVKRKDILLPTAFVFLWQATPTADTAMFYFYTNHLHFEPEFLGRVRLAGSVASLAGVALYNGVFKKVRGRAGGQGRGFGASGAGWVRPPLTVHAEHGAAAPAPSYYPDPTQTHPPPPPPRCPSSACSCGPWSSAPPSAPPSCSSSAAPTARWG